MKILRSYIYLISKANRSIDKLIVEKSKLKINYFSLKNKQITFKYIIKRQKVEKI